MSFSQGASAEVGFNIYENHTQKLAIKSLHPLGWWGGGANEVSATLNMTFIPTTIFIAGWANARHQPTTKTDVVSHQSAAQTAPTDPIQFSGYLDVSYNRIDGQSSFTNGVPARVFDLQQESTRWQQLAFFLTDQPKEGWGGIVNVTTGHDADVIPAFKTGTGKLFDLTQAFVQYAKGPYTGTFGKFVTLAGEEVIDSRADWNFSRSILFGYAIPFSHAGIRFAAAPANSKVTYLIGANNGWDALDKRNSSVTIEANATFTASPKLTLATQGYFGKERITGVPTDPEGTRNLIDAVLTYKATDKTTIVLNYDYATQANASTATVTGSDKATWSGLAGYVHFVVNPKWSVTARAEYFDDHDGYRTGFVQKWQEGTLTLGYTPNSELEFRLEGRADNSNTASFLKKGGSSSKTLNSVGLEALVKF